MKYPDFPTIPNVRFALVPNYAGYAASDDGRVWTCRFNRWGFSNNWRELAATPNNKYGRCIIRLGRKRVAYLHHVILEAFVGPRPEGMEALHGNGDAGDNRLSNLRWGTRLENLADFAKHGKKKGENHHRAKLTATEVLEIRRLAAQGQTHQLIADKFTVRREAVSKIIRRERWQHI